MHMPVQHSSSTCICNLYLSVNTIFQSLWFPVMFSLMMLLLARKLLIQDFLAVM